MVVGFLSDRDVLRVGEGLAIGLIGLSLVPLTGYAGQVSLCPLAFAGLGAVMMSKFGDGGSWMGLVAAIAVPATVGALVALPALRLQGLYLALSTLAFAVLMDNMIFPQRRLFWTSSVTVDRLDIPFVSLAGDRAWFVVLAAAYGVLAVLVLAMRRGSFGRRLLALKDSPVACATLGMSLTRTKLVVFALSAGMAGLGGALYAGLRVGVSAKSFTAIGGLGILLIAVIGGIELASGPLVGGLTLAAMTIVSQDIAALDWLAAIGPAFVAVTLARNREGLAIRLAEIGRGLAGWRQRRTRLATDWLASIDSSLAPHTALRPEQVDALEDVFRIEPALCTAEPVR